MQLLKAVGLTFLTLLFFVSCSGEQESDSTVLKGPYLGQTTPGTTAELFAPGIITTRFHEHSYPSFSPDGEEMFYTLAGNVDHTIIYTKMVDGIWTLPEIASFSGKYTDDKVRFSPDGNTIYFRSQRPIDGGTEQGTTYYDWYSKKVDGVWGQAQRYQGIEGLPTKNGKVYWSIKNADGKEDVTVRNLVNGEYSEPEMLWERNDPAIRDVIQYISLDGEFMIIASGGRPENIGVLDLYISFRNTADDGISDVWSEPVHMGTDINKPNVVTRFPGISPDGNIFFFCRDKKEERPTTELTYFEQNLLRFNPWREPEGVDNDIYWVSSTIIERFKGRSIK